MDALRERPAIWHGQPRARVTKNPAKHSQNNPDSWHNAKLGACLLFGHRPHCHAHGHPCLKTGLAPALRRKSLL
jgi:hypothetical protein